jgi:small-conductance mechanosensitive channel
MNGDLPQWVQGWMGTVEPMAVVLLIMVVAMLSQRIAWRLTRKVGDLYHVPHEILVVVRRITAFVIYAGALVLILERLGVPSTALWTAFTGFAAVGAVAFFAAWSVLSNIFCTMLIFTTRPFRLTEYIEMLESADKPGMRGRVHDINLIYTTLDEIGADGETTGSSLQIPNSLFFQRTVRRWRGQQVPRSWLESAEPTGRGK